MTRTYSLSLQAQNTRHIGFKQIMKNVIFISDNKDNNYINQNDNNIFMKKVSHSDSTRISADFDDSRAFKKLFDSFKNTVKLNFFALFKYQKQ